MDQNSIDKSIVADHEQTIIAITDLSSNGYIQHDNFTKQNTSQTGFTLDLLYQHDRQFSVLQWLSLSLDLNPIEHLRDVVEREVRIMKVLYEVY